MAAIAAGALMPTFITDKPTRGPRSRFKHFKNGTGPYSKSAVATRLAKAAKARAAKADTKEKP